MTEVKPLRMVRLFTPAPGFDVTKLQSGDILTYQLRSHVWTIHRNGVQLPAGKGEKGKVSYHCQAQLRLQDVVGLLVFLLGIAGLRLTRVHTPNLQEVQVKVL